MFVMSAFYFIVLMRVVSGFAVQDLPDQIHLALASPLNASVSISWVTHNQSQSEVWFGLLEDDLSGHVTGSSQQYTFDSTLYGHYISPYLHSASLPRLVPDQTYFYACGDAELGMSEVLSFTSPPEVGNPTAFEVALLGDIGQTSDSEVTLGRMMELPLPSLVLHAGDLSYADCDQERWDDWGRMVEPLASIVPWMTGPGNHEIELEEVTGRAFVAYEARFNMPRVKPAQFKVSAPSGVRWPQEKGCTADDIAAGIKCSLALRPLKHVCCKDGPPQCTPSEWLGQYDYGNSFYSFDYASLHVIFLNSYTSSDPTSEQYRWLKSDLDGVDRVLTPWVVVLTHCPWYNSNLAHQLESQTIAMKRNIEGMLNDARVALVVSGHVHAYERTRPLKAWAVTPGAPVYLIIGAGGNREGHASTYYGDHLQMPYFSAKRDGTSFGHGRLRIVNETHAFWRWLPNNNATSENSDEAWITNPYTVHTAEELFSWAMEKKLEII